MTIDEAIEREEALAYSFGERYKRLGEPVGELDKLEAEHQQLAEWLKELQWYRKQIQNLIDNKSFEIVNPYNAYEYARVVRVADLYDLMEVNADDE